MDSLFIGKLKAAAGIFCGGFWLFKCLSTCIKVFDLIRDINLKFKLVLCREDEVLGAARHEAQAQEQHDALGLEFGRRFSLQDALNDSPDPLQEKIHLEVLCFAAKGSTHGNTIGRHDECIDRTAEIFWVLDQVVDESAEHV